MKKHTIQCLALLLVLILAAALAGCGASQSTGPSEPAAPSEPGNSSPASAASSGDGGAYTIPEGTVLTIAIPDKTNVEDYNTNETTLAIEEALGVDLQFETFPATDFEQKITLMIQGGDKLPDIIMMAECGLDKIYSWALEGALTPLSEFYADPQLAANIQATYDSVGDFRPLITLPDGEIYNIPKYAQSIGNEQGAKLWADMSVLEDLNLPVPKTTDELADTLRAIKAAKPDMIGIAGYEGIYGGTYNSSYWFDYLMNSFVYSNSNSNFLKADDGKVSFAYTDPAWKEGIKYIKSLIDEGLIAKESLTQDRDAWITMINSCEVFSLCYITPSDFSDGRKDLFECVDPMKGPDGVQLARYNPTQPNGGMVITADCEDPKAAFLVGDLMCSLDFTITNRWGQKGLDWDYFEDYAQTLDNYNEAEWAPTTPGCEKLIIVYDDPTFWGSGNMQNRAYMGVGPQIRDFGVAGGRTVNAETITPYTAHAAAGYQQYPPFYPDETVPSLMYTAEESEIITQVMADLRSYVETTCSNWLLGVGDIDAEWDAFQDELKKIGIDRAVEVAQAAYTRANG